MEFTPLYYGDRLRLINPTGDVGIVTLWTPVRTAMRLLRDALPDAVDPTHSRVAVVSNLYGDGIYAMFCNLLYNPQIRHLIAVGEDLDLPTCREITAFLEQGMADATMFGQRLKRIRGEDRFFPAADEFDGELLRDRLTFRYLGRLGPTALAALGEQLRVLPVVRDESARRIRVDMQEFVPDEYSFRPSRVEAHQVVRRGPLDCWEELVVRVMRFGNPVTLRTGHRLELLNAKVVITRPEPETAEVLARYGFKLDQFHAYQRRILDAVLPEGISYTYGNRLRGYFDQGPNDRDTLATVIDLLADNPETRHAYLSIWDTVHDMTDSADISRPCLTTLFFRRHDGRLTLTATYRSHNMLTAWLENVYGLMAIQRHVADAVGMPIGSITVLSHSLGADPSGPLYSFGRAIDTGWNRDEDIDRSSGRHILREDPNGYFAVTVDENERCIVAEHRIEGLLIKRYKAGRAATIERAIIGDMAVSVVSHAMWLGRELAAKERLLRELNEHSASSSRIPEEVS